MRFVQLSSIAFVGYFVTAPCKDAIKLYFL